MTVTEIKKAIKHLDQREFLSLSDWFAKIEEEKWDKELESDIANGKLGKLAQAALDEYKTGKCKQL